MANNTKINGHEEGGHLLVGSLRSITSLGGGGRLRCWQQQQCYYMVSYHLVTWRRGGTRARVHFDSPALSPHSDLPHETPLLFLLAAVYRKLVWKLLSYLFM